MKLWNKIRYGDTSTPKYIVKKHYWVYKNVIYSTESLIGEIASENDMTLQHTTYSYELNGTIYEKEDFAAVLQVAIAHPFEFKIYRMSDYGPHELEAFRVLIKRQSNKNIAALTKKIQQLQDELAKIR